MYVERYGTGPRTLLGLHGWGSDRRVFEPIAARVPPDVSFYSADLPGCGASPLPNKWTIKEIVAEILGTVCEFGPGRVTVVGHCGGAVFGLLAARAAGRLIERVVRRNRCTLHLVFGEGTALLAALALLNQSYKLCAEAARSHACVERLVSEATYAVGPEGMIGGQMLDLELKADYADTRSLAGRDLKTVALMGLMMTAGAIATGANDADTRALRVFGESIGKAYQVCDDLLDECHLSAIKTVGQDARHGRASAVSALGRPGAYRLALELTERSTHALAAHFGPRAEVQLLADAAHYVINQVPDFVTEEDYSLTAAGD